MAKNEDSYLFFYATLGNLKNVYLTTSHIQNFVAPKGLTSGKTKIGQIGGKGGASTQQVAALRALSGNYIHSHFSIFAKGKHGPALPRHDFAKAFCK